MRLERLTNNKIKIFLTFDDLQDRGLSKEDVLKDSLKWHQLFHDLLDEATNELGIEITGSVAVEIFSLQAQGMVLILTVDTEDIEFENEDVDYTDHLVEMEVRMEGRDDILFEFQDFEDVIQFSLRVYPLSFSGGTLLQFQNKYFLFWNDYNPIKSNALISLLSEYGQPSVLTIHKINEYGKQLILEDAIEKVNYYFKTT